MATPRLVVLVVEDEPLIRLDAVDLIESAGFEVIEARNADHAIEILNARRDIRLIVLYWGLVVVMRSFGVELPDPANLLPYSWGLHR